MKKTTHIVNNYGAFNSRFYTLKGKLYEVIATLSTGPLAIQAIDTIKNVKTGEFKDIERKRLYSVTRNN